MDSDQPVDQDTGQMGDALPPASEPEADRTAAVGGLIPYGELCDGHSFGPDTVFTVPQNMAHIRYKHGTDGVWVERDVPVELVRELQARADAGQSFGFSPPGISETIPIKLEVGKPLRIMVKGSFNPEEVSVPETAMFRASEAARAAFAARLQEWVREYFARKSVL